MSLFAHHAEAFFHIEIMGRDFPDGMTEHVLAAVVGVAVAALTLYGAYSAIRDLRFWRRGRGAATAGTAN